MLEMWHPAFNFPRVNHVPARASLLPSQRQITNKNLVFQVEYHFVYKDKTFRCENPNDQTVNLALLRPKQNVLA